MKVTEIYPSNFIAAGDLDGREVTLTITKVADKDTVRREDKTLIDKAVLYFGETPRGLVLGKTNAKRIQLCHGNEMSKWVGKKVTIYPTSTEIALSMAEQNGCPILAVRGKMATVPCIRVKIDRAMADAPEIQSIRKPANQEKEEEW